ncbi:cytochrome P450 monooxygenase-like protein [Zopfia rhizophila CBS 207.26]|uniref:Cytochrome P450 monooxygenase-like protein n=1 Tax=Zopfia rhizophila CBS 207.26 TaxID=1314779 RepID=A0A6A6DFE7_9PEZI|nr:cytochrome P450 monooxygenase-like protein [Zopfia rhizophila CBS 207.26]
MLEFPFPFSVPIIPFLLPLLFIFHILYRYFAAPLYHVPAAHPLAHITSLWILYIRFRAIENQTLKAAHGRLGPVIRLGPKEVSVNCVKGGIREVYAGGMEKGDGGYSWYSFFSNYGGVPNMFSTAGNRPHSTRKRMLSNVYSKSVVTSSPALLAQASSILYERFLPSLSSTFSSPDPGVLNMYAFLCATTMDIVTGYIFGLASSSNLISNPKQLDWFLDLYNSRRSYNFWPQELPNLTEWVRRVGYRLVPKWVDEANGEIEKWTEGMCESAAAVLRLSEVKVEDTPVVYQQLSAALSREAKKAGNEKADLTYPIASEVLDHLAAGFDTSGITLTYVIHQLSKNPSIQDNLRTELLSLSPPLIPSSAPVIPDPKAVDALPLLHAVIWETLRLHPAIPGPQPRVTPPSGCRLGPEERSYYIPAGVRVSASAGILHSNEEVYEKAGEWRPQRWLEKVGEEKKKDMESRWFWSFGSGAGRMCVGSHLAVYQMKYIVAALYSNFETHIIDDTGIEQSDAYTAPPKSGKLMIRLEHVNTG